jgi:hypothetical protein
LVFNKVCCEITVGKISLSAEEVSEKDSGKAHKPKRGGDKVKVTSENWVTLNNGNLLSHISGGRRQRSRCLQSHAPSEGSREAFLAPSQLFVASGNLSCSLVCN